MSKSIIKYINTLTSQGVETVDQFDYNTKEERKEFKRVLREYHMMGYYYSSQRCTKEWGNR